MAEQDAAEAALDPFSLEALPDPYPIYARMRDETPVARNPHPSVLTGSWLLARHRDAMAALRDHDAFASDPRHAADGKGLDDPFMDLLRSDPPLHTKLRALIADAFGPPRIRALEPRIREIIAALLDRAGSGEVEVMGALCVPLPLTVIAELLGIPRERHADFKRWSDARVSSVISRDERRAAMGELTAFFRDIAEQRRRAPREDLVTTLVQGRLDDEPLNDAQLVAFCGRVLVAGNETTTNLLGNMLRALADHPELWSRLREDRSLVPAVVEETLRFDTPVHALVRYTTRAVEVAGTTIPAGERVGVLFGSANHDEAVYDCPEEFRPNREGGRHLSFGFGIHYCPGAPLARAEASIVLNSMLDRYERLELTSEPPERQVEAATLRGFRRLPLRLVAAAPGSAR
jgi:cytochrome P450